MLFFLFHDVLDRLIDLLSIYQFEYKIRMIALYFTLHFRCVTESVPTGAPMTTTPSK